VTSTGQGEPQWFTSGRSGGGDCVEVAIMDHAVLVRDSKDPGGPVLTYSRDAWLAFLADLPEGPPSTP
jgi:Domain of unknown function (DUF397)